MISLNKTATTIFNKLTSGMETGTSRKIDTTDEVFMPVHVEFLYVNGPWKHYSVAHYFESNGDLCPDPDMEFLVGPEGIVVPRAMTQIHGYTEAVEVDADGSLRINKRALTELISFAHMWMKNIASQQDLSAAI